VINLSQVFDKKSLVVVFAYVPAGLGHLRITDSFFHGLPEGVNPLLLGPEDGLTTFFHRITSVNPVAKSILEWQQQGLPDVLYTRFMRWFLKSSTDKLYQELRLVLEQRMDLPKTVLVVSTHFGLAHQLVAIKRKIEEDRHLKMIIVLQVTDDSFQRLWYVPGVDLTFVPSEKTKNLLEKYGKDEHLPLVAMEVLPYPVDPLVAEKMNPYDFINRASQLSMGLKNEIHMAIPVSGAAVGMTFLTHMIDALHDKSNRFKFHIISKSTPFTQDFLKEMVNRPFVDFEVSFSSREIIDKYTELYKKEIISLEITKPSEQSFKALLTPDQKGGAILLFSDPIGKQEYDNLDFLRRHHLIPLKSEMEQMWADAENGMEIDGGGKWILEKAKHWRGLMLPYHSAKAANFIWWCLGQGIFKTMVQQFVLPENEDHELGSDGVKLFWQEVAKLVAEKS
jgi:hypothetical protein